MLDTFLCNWVMRQNKPLYSFFLWFIWNGFYDFSYSQIFFIPCPQHFLDWHRFIFSSFIRTIPLFFFSQTFDSIDSFFKLLHTTLDISFQSTFYTLLSWQALKTCHELSTIKFKQQTQKQNINKNFSDLKTVNCFHSSNNK